MQKKKLIFFFRKIGRFLKEPRGAEIFDVILNKNGDFVQFFGAKKPDLERLFG